MGCLPDIWFITTTTLNIIYMGAGLVVRKFCGFFRTNTKVQATLMGNFPVLALKFPFTQNTLLTMISTSHKEYLRPIMELSLSTSTLAQAYIELI